MSFQITIARSAARDIRNLYDRMAARSRTAADRWRDRILAAVETLADHPERCPESPEAEWYGPGLRELYSGKRRNTYRILFEVRGDTVHVLHVRHGRQDFLRPDEM
jgi:plasmid stabilization system protein ParE